MINWSKVFIAVLVVLSCFSYAKTPPQKPVLTTGCISGDCINGYGIFIHNSITEYLGDKYEGNFINGNENGIGTYTFADGKRKYEGNFKNGKYHGLGEFTFTNGMIYEGNFLNDLPNGQGKIYYVDGSMYEGEVKNMVYHGFGTLTYPKKSAGAKQKFAYKGEWNNGNRHGKGMFHSPDGNVYDGELENNQYHGLGIYYNWYPLFYIYYGEWKNNNYNGQGIMVFLEENSEIGTWSGGSLIEKQTSSNVISYFKEHYQNKIDSTTIKSLSYWIKE